MYPIIAGFHPDPSVCRMGDTYYLVTSSFEFFPGIPVFRLRDLMHWDLISHCLTRDSQADLSTCKPSGGIWAPTIRFHQGRFYVVVTDASRMFSLNSGNFYVYSDDPAGPWSDPVDVRQVGIDPSLFFDDDGTCYLTSNGNGGIWQSVIDISDGRAIVEPKLIWAGTGGRCPEGPHLYKVNGLYYLMIAEGGTEYGHMVTIARSASPWGPWDVYAGNPILMQRDSPDEDLQCTGHADLVQAENGGWHMVFLGVRAVDGYFHHLGRETFLSRVIWTEGWPQVQRLSGEASWTAPAIELVCTLAA